MTTAVVLFTRDLRVHDHPALHAAVQAHDQVVPLFVLDDAILASPYARPNRVGFLLESLRDLRGSLVERGGSLVVRRGDVVEVVRDLCAEVGADALHVSADVGVYAQNRERALRRLVSELGIDGTTHPGITVVPPGELAPQGADHYRVFTPYDRRWRDHPLRPLLPPPDRVALPPSLARGRLPALGDLATGRRSPHVVRGGESEARRRLASWLRSGIDGYPEARDDLAAAGTSGLSPYLHLGCLSPREIVHRLDLRRRGHEPFRRQLAWRDFHHQTTWAHPTIARDAYRPRGDDWHDDADAFAAWTAGRTGYPIVDAGMRQLRREGFLHNRVRMIVASFLVKTLYVDWRLGARHFLDWLVDGDIANNAANWQWVAGTGTDTRPNRVLNPVRQGQRHDPDGTYVRRYVPELADVPASLIHTPWELPPERRRDLDYPAPIVDHLAGRRRFLAARGAR